jgi:hypothetical protein
MTNFSIVELDRSFFNAFHIAYLIPTIFKQIKYKEDRGFHFNFKQTEEFPGVLYRLENLSGRIRSLIEYLIEKILIKIREIGYLPKEYD